MHDKYVNKISTVEEVFVVYSFWELAHQESSGKGDCGENKIPHESGFSTLGLSVEI